MQADFACRFCHLQRFRYETINQAPVYEILPSGERLELDDEVLNPQPRLGFAYDGGGGSGVHNLLVLKSLLKGRYADLILEKERGFDGLEKFSFATKSGRQYKTTCPDGHVDRRTCRCVADTHGKNI